MEDHKGNTSIANTVIPWSQTFLSRPKVQWNEFTLCEGTIDTQPLMINQDQLASVLAEVYPNKNLIDIFNLLDFFNQHQETSVKPQSLATAYGFHWTEYHHEFLNLYQIWPKDFLVWCQQKNLQITDLRPLLLLKKHPELKKYLSFLSTIAKNRCSYSEGKIVIELSVDLFCQNPESLNILEKADAKDNATWINRLKRLRYPLTQDMDQMYKAFIDKQRWPLQCQFKRMGDKKGFLVSVFIANLSDLEKNKQNINQSFDKISKFYEDKT